MVFISELALRPLYTTGTVWHWHATSGKCVGDTIVEENNQTYALDVRGDGASFATTGYDGAVRVYDEVGGGALQARPLDPTILKKAYSFIKN